MINYEIIDIYTGEAQFTAKIDCGKNARMEVKKGLAVKWAIENGADLSYADLSYADLSYADLTGVNLRRANLIGADLTGANLTNSIAGLSDYIKSISIEAYNVIYTHNMIFIGCEYYAIEEWRNFDDAEIIKMDGKTALKFWRKYKDFIFTAIDLAPAKPTKGDS